MANGSLTFIGMGLHDEMGLSLRGLDLLRDSDEVFAELYTSRMPGLSLDHLSQLSGKRIHVLSREEVEERANKTILVRAGQSKVALLVPGDPMSATTHVDLRLRAHKMGISTRVIHAASIISATAGVTGLQSYKFGRTVTMPFSEKIQVAPSVKAFIRANIRTRLHTLVLLEVAQQGFVSANQAAKALYKSKVIGRAQLVVVLARVDSPDMIVRAGSAEYISGVDFGTAPHALVIPSKLHFVEAEALRIFAGAPPGLLPGKK